MLLPVYLRATRELASGHLLDMQTPLLMFAVPVVCHYFLGDNMGRPLVVVGARRMCICGLISSSHVHSWPTAFLARDITHARFGVLCATGLLAALLGERRDKGDATHLVLIGLLGEEMEPRLRGEEPWTGSKLASRGSKYAMVSSKVSVSTSRAFSVNALGWLLSTSRSNASRSLR